MPGLHLGPVRYESLGRGVFVHCILTSSPSDSKAQQGLEITESEGGQVLCARQSLAS